MTVTPRPDEIRQIVARVFLQSGAGRDAVADLEETICLDRGKGVARSYRADGLLAMWLVGVGILQFYDPAGNMLRTVNLLEEVKPVRMAA